jgi:hypothetical protein
MFAGKYEDCLFLFPPPCLTHSLLAKWMRESRNLCIFRDLYKIQCSRQEPITHVSVHMYVISSKGSEDYTVT